MSLVSYRAYRVLTLSSKICGRGVLLLLELLALDRDASCIALSTTWEYDGECDREAAPLCFGFEGPA